MDFDDFGISNKSASVSASISPLCHRLCSEKIKDRQEAMGQLKNLLSDGQRPITESSGVMMLNAVKRYALLESKGSAQNTLGKALRDWRWAVGLVSHRYPGIFVPDLPTEVISFIEELANPHLACTNLVVHEGLLILGRHVLCKPAYLQKLKEGSIEKLLKMVSNLTNQTEVNDLLKVLALIVRCQCMRILKREVVDQILQLVKSLLERNYKQGGSDYASSGDVFSSLCLVKNYSDNYNESTDLSEFYELAPKYALGIRNMNCFPEIVSFCDSSVIVENDLWRQLIEKEISKPRLNALLVDDFNGAVKQLMEIGSRVYSIGEIIMYGKNSKYYAAMAYLRPDIRVKPGILQGITNSEVLAWWIKKLSEEADVEVLFEECDLEYFYSLLFKKTVWPFACTILKRMMHTGHFNLFNRFFEKFQAFASVNDSVESLEVTGLLIEYLRTQKQWRNSWDPKLSEEVEFIKQWITNVLNENCSNPKILKHMGNCIKFIDEGSLPTDSLLSGILGILQRGACDNLIELADPLPLLELYPQDTASPEQAIQFLVKWYKHLGIEKSANGHVSHLPSSSLEEEFIQPFNTDRPTHSKIVELKILRLSNYLSTRCTDKQFGSDAMLFVEKSVNGILIEEASYVSDVVKLFNIQHNKSLESLVMERLHYLLNDRVRALDPSNLLTVSLTLEHLLKQSTAWVFDREPLVLMLQFLLNKAISRKVKITSELFEVLAEKRLLEAEVTQVYLACNYLERTPSNVILDIAAIDIRHLLRYLLMMPIKECVRCLLNINRRVPQLQIFDPRDVQKICTRLFISGSQLAALFGLGEEIGWWPGKLKMTVDASEDPRVQAVLVLEKKSRPRTFGKELVAAILLNTLEYGGEAVYGVLKGKTLSEAFMVLVEMLDWSRTPLMDDYLTCALVVYERLYGAMNELQTLLTKFIQSKYHEKITLEEKEWDYKSARMFAIHPNKYMRAELERIYEKLYQNGCSPSLLCSELRTEVLKYKPKVIPCFSSVKEAYLFELVLRFIALGDLEELKSYLVVGEGVKRGTFEESFPGVPKEFIEEQLRVGTIKGKSVLDQMNPSLVTHPLCSQVTEAQITVFFSSNGQLQESAVERFFDWNWLRDSPNALFVLEGVHAMAGKCIPLEQEGLYEVYKKVYGEEFTADTPHFPSEKKYLSKSSGGARKFVFEGLTLTNSHNERVMSDYDLSLYSWLKNTDPSYKDAFLFGSALSVEEKIEIRSMRKSFWECVLGRRPVEDILKESEMALESHPELIEILGMASQRVAVLRPLCGIHLAESVMSDEGKPEKAMQILKTNLNPKCFADKSTVELQVRMLLKMAEWSLKYKNEPHTLVQKNYLETALRLTEGNQKLRTRCAHELGVFLEGRYRALSEPSVIAAKAEQIKKYQEQHVALRMNMEALNQRVQMLRKAANSPQLAEEEGKLNELYRTVTSLSSEIKIDVQELQRMTEERQTCYQRTMGLYGEVLMYSDAFDMDVFRLVSLWFEEVQSALGAELLTARGFEKMLSSIPSHKFVPLMTQILAKAEQLLAGTNNAETSSFSSKKMKVQGEKENYFNGSSSYAEVQVKVMKKLIARLCAKHPYHCLWALICMSNQALVLSTNNNNMMIETANSVSCEVLKAMMSSNLADIAKGVLQGGRLYSELAGAGVPCDSYNRPLQKTFKYEPKWAAQPIPSCPVPTANIKVEPDGKYPNVPMVRSLGSGYSVIGGLSMPKIIECTGSDGRVYKQLVKGKDDVRQDAMVEQLFLTVNRLLNRGLRVRTFRVVPLHATAGILEWVADSLPIGDYLIPAHERWRPQDWTSKAIRAKLHKLLGGPEEVPVEERIRIGKEIFANIQPIMRYFFFEYFSPGNDNHNNNGSLNWLQARNEFTRSVAVSSMLGYLVGLGDRHVQNILLDCKTGEVVHIDLNMIFEGGRNLKIPERVPFRLTRDILDGLGPWGTHQGFRKHATSTLAALRQNSTMLLTVIGVVAQPQVRERALRRVQERLSGVVEGGGEWLSETAQVLALEREASSVENLCLMYHGWSFWL